MQLDFLNYQSWVKRKIFLRSFAQKQEWFGPVATTAQRLCLVRLRAS